MRKFKKKEESIQIQVCTFLKWQYPHLLWVCDFAAGSKLTIGQAVKAKKLRSCRGLPDIMIFQPNKHYHGLFLELKTVTPFKKGGDLKKDEHLAEQMLIHVRLHSEGYRVKFVVGFDEAIKEVADYLADVKR